MPCPRCVAGMRGEQPGGPQLMRITQLFGLLARTSQVFASAVMIGSRPARGRSSSGSITPSSVARSRQRVTVCCVTPIVRATAYADGSAK